MNPFIFYVAWFLTLTLLSESHGAAFNVVILYAVASLRPIIVADVPKEAAKLLFRIGLNALILLTCARVAVRDVM